MKDIDFSAMRERMVRDQLAAKGISDKRVLDAFLKVPRHKFVPDSYIENAYSDFPLPIGSDQTISQPYMVALMTELLRVGKDHRILEVGTGSGYQLAILCELAREAYSVERMDNLAAKARLTLEGLGYKNFDIGVGDGTLGWHEHAPYNGIVVTAGAPGIPGSLLSQLAEGGRLVIPVGGSLGQILTLVERAGDSFKKTEICGCVFVPLVGKDGWPSINMRG